MTRVLVTGMSGVGKSAVAAALSDRGYAAIDTDGQASRVSTDGEWLWNEVEIERVLALGDQVVFIVGSASNQVRFYDRFDQIILLSAPTEVMQERISRRSNNPFGKAESEMAKILADKAAIEPLLRRRADHEIETDRPLVEVIDELLHLTTMRLPRVDPETLRREVDSIIEPGI